MNQTAWEDVGMTTSKPRAVVTRSTGGESAGFRRWVDGEWTVAPFRQKARRNTGVGQTLQRPGNPDDGRLLDAGLRGLVRRWGRCALLPYASATAA